MVKRFLIYGLLGWCLEVFWTGLGSLVAGNIKLPGQTYIWMFPIYGLAVFLEPIHDHIRSLPVVLRGGMYTVLIFIVEYATGKLLKMIIGVCPWNYGTGVMTIEGIVTFYFIPVWFAVGLLFEKLHDYLIQLHILKNA